ncbi:hypothetical protein CLOP_g9465 [Closterium sp. NIES-67]|nr:hypothetical protein CLOP_g9465 [Closterium sp. NIES-67]
MSQSAASQLMLQGSARLTDGLRQALVLEAMRRRAFNAFSHVDFDHGALNRDAVDNGAALALASIVSRGNTASNSQHSARHCLTRASSQRG